MFWADEGTDNPRQSLRMALSGLRTTLGDAVKTEGEQVWLDPDTCTSDYQEFLSLSASLEGMSAAIELPHEEFCLGIEGDWVEAERSDFLDKYAETAGAFMDLCLENKAFQQGIELGTLAVRRVGYREEVTEKLIRLCIQGGFFTLAMSHFEALERELEEKWGQQPAKRVVELLDSIPVQSRPSRAIIGRQSEFQSLVQTFYSSDRGRVVSLIGPGGIGKTTLARSVLRELETAGRQVRFIDLTASNSFNSAIRIICTALNLGEIDLDGAPLAIAKTLANQKIVATFDNLEQLGDDADRIVDKILQSSDNVNLILTTRNKLSLPKVEEFIVHPLDLPNLNSTLTEVRNSSSVQLFEKRANYVSHGFSINRGNAEAVAELCQKLDGLPLALEIAAAKIIVQSPSKILEQIRKSLKTLEKKHGAKSSRHSSINAAVNWSVGLLSDEERTAALRLSLINGRFSAQLAAEITEHPNILDILESLIRSSLLNADSTGNETQFWMYETVRLSLQDCFRDDESFVVARNRQLDVTMSRLSEIAAIKDMAQWKVLQLDLAVCPDALDTMEFFAARSERIEDVASTAVRIQEACRLFGLFHRNIQCLESVFDHLPKGVLWANAGLALVRSRANQGAEDSKIVLLNNCEAAAGDDLPTLLAIKSQMATNYKSAGRFEEAVELCNWIEKHSEETDYVTKAANYYLLNHLAYVQGDREATLPFLEKALLAARKQHDVNRLIRILFDYGSELAYHSRFAEAEEKFDEAIAQSQRMRSSKLEGLARWQYGYALIRAGRHRDSLEMILKSIELVYIANYQVSEKWIFLNACEAATGVGLSEPAAKLLGKGVHIRDVENRVYATSETEALEETRQKLIEDLGRGEFERLASEGRESEWADLWAQLKIAKSSLESRDDLVTP